MRRRSEERLLRVHTSREMVTANATDASDDTHSNADSAVAPLQVTFRQVEWEHAAYTLPQLASMPCSHNRCVLCSEYGIR